MDNTPINQHLKNMSIMLQMLMFPFQAESAAYIVALRLSLDTSAYSFPYIKSWLKSKDEIKEIADATQKAAYEMITKLASYEGALFNLQEE